MDITSIGIVVPVMDEEETLEELYQTCAAAVSKLDLDFEIVFVDDGSVDTSWAVMCALQKAYPENVKAIRLRRNFGKALALSAGFKAVSGDVVFTMDADLQDDPKEIGKFLAKIQEGYDCVSGWKVDRRDPSSKTIPSRLFNRVTAAISGIQLHDFNCGFKAYRSEVVENVDVYGELHRYIPILAHDYGYRIGEVEVEHHPRLHGVSKYGWERYTRGLVDLITVMATTRYAKKPGHLYGGLGILSGAVGSIILGYLAGLWVFGLGPIGNRPLFFAGILLIILAFQLVSLGVLAEMMIRASSPLQSVDKFVAERTPD
jgi:glycosyltransferase involved in cell wall biosynthesis